MDTNNRPTLPIDGFQARRLISVDDLSSDDIHYLLSMTDYFADFLRMGARPQQRLAGKTQINLFYENSTRTNLSFELAGKKLGADVINVPVAASSVNKDESLIDTTQTLAAMGAHIMIVRQQSPGLLESLADKIQCPIVNAGDGVREHPTQALLDAATIKSVFGTLEGKIIAICGDIRHSRVAASGARLFKRLGATVRFVAPEYLLPDNQQSPQSCFSSLQEGLANADIVMALRMQFERMQSDDDIEKASKDYFADFGLTHQTLNYAKPNAFVMHPGPINRGVEIDGALADDPRRSLILQQVFYGVAVRMACLDALLTNSASSLANSEELTNLYETPPNIADLSESGLVEPTSSYSERHQYD
ncbi:MAG: aspartate carbamoyltransferase catalytic subunit [Pseudomonadota bacterium]